MKGGVVGVTVSEMKGSTYNINGLTVGNIRKSLPGEFNQGQIFISGQSNKLHNSTPLTENGKYFVLPELKSILTISGQINTQKKIKFLNNKHWKSFKSISKTGDYLTFNIDDGPVVTFDLKQCTSSENKDWGKRYNLKDTSDKTYRVDIYNDSDIIEFDDLCIPYIL